MTDRPDPAQHDADDMLERALKSDALASATTIPDDGFTARVMAKLPARAALPAWRKPMVGLLWSAAACGAALALPGTLTDVAHGALRLLAQPISLSQIGITIAALAAVAWSAAAWTLSDDV